MRNKINVERAKIKITQAELAHKVGVTPQTIHAIETGKFVPSATLAMKIAKFFDTKVHKIFKLEESDE